VPSVGAKEIRSLGQSPACSLCCGALRCAGQPFLRVGPSVRFRVFGRRFGALPSQLWQARPRPNRARFSFGLGPTRAGWREIRPEDRSSPEAVSEVRPPPVVSSERRGLAETPSDGGVAPPHQCPRAQSAPAVVAGASRENKRGHRRVAQPSRSDLVRELAHVRATLRASRRPVCQARVWPGWLNSFGPTPRGCLVSSAP
jgi:hypothetical protein